MPDSRTKVIVTTRRTKPKKPLFKAWWGFVALICVIVYSVAVGGEADAPEELPQHPVQEEVVSVQGEKEIPVESILTESPATAPVDEHKESAPTPEPQQEVASTSPDSAPFVEEPVAEAPIVAVPVPEEPATETPPTVKTEPIGKMVYVSQTGKKYHKNPTCSGMKKPIEMPLEEAQKRRTPCENCY